MRIHTRPILLFLMIVAAAAAVGGPGVSADNGSPSVDVILDGVEARYAGDGFSARFDQSSTLKAIDITDTATGTIHAARPGKMRWEYETPSPQLIVTDGITLWIYRPDDRQVLVGEAPDYFGDGKGASFLSDIRTVRKNFTITRVPDDGPEQDHYRLRLDPKKDIPGLSFVHMDVSKSTHDVIRVITVNPYGDETVISFSQLALDETFPDGYFHFDIPSDVDVLQLENQELP